MKFRVITEGAKDYHHYFAKGDIVVLTGALEGQQKEFICVEGTWVGLEQLLKDSDVEAIE